MQDFILNKILLQTDCQVIRAFLDGLLKENLQSEQALEDYGEKLNEQWHKGEVHKYTTVLHRAAAEDDVNILEFTLKSLKTAGDLETLKDMVFAVDYKGRNVFYLAAENKSLQAINKLTEWVKRLTATSTHN